MARKKTPKQVTIEGTERKAIPAIRKAAETYVEIRDERMELTEREVEANEKLVQVMTKHDVVDYTDEDAQIRVTIRETKTKAKVATIKQRGADDGE